MPDIVSDQPDMCRGFYSDFLGLKVQMDMGTHVAFVSLSQPNAQVLVVKRGAEPALSDFSITVEVEDVDRAHADAVARGYRVVYPLTNEPWGVRRFFVTDPNGVVVNVMCHTST